MQIFIEQSQRVTKWEGQELSIPPQAIWIDLLNPTREEESAVEKFLAMPIPTRDEMSEIEVSSRLYHDHGAYFMTATMVTKVDSGTPETHAVTFILTDHCLVTIRYVEATSFRRFHGQAGKREGEGVDGADMFLGLIESVVDRMADILERLDRDIDRITKDIFRNPDAPGETAATVDYRSVLDRIGRCGDLSSKVHESLVTYGRVVAFAGHHKKLHGPQHHEWLEELRKDINGLGDHGTYLTGRVNFLLDATLGMISIQQNKVFSVLSVASLIFLPPTLVAGIYGMNFQHMPELSWHFGYPIALTIMLLAAVLPIAYLRRRKYL